MPSPVKMVIEYSKSLFGVINKKKRRRKYKERKLIDVTSDLSLGAFEFEACGSFEGPRKKRKRSMAVE